MLTNQTPSPSYQRLGYRYENGTIKGLGREQTSFSTTLRPEWLGQTVAFPTIEGANGRRVDVPVDIKNEGMFQQLTVTQTTETKSVPQGADWIADPQDRLLREDIQATFQGGGSLSRTDNQVLVNGQSSSLNVSASAEAVVLSQPRNPYPSDYHHKYTQTIHKDGTIVWRDDSARENWNTTTFKPDGSVSGVHGRITYAGERVETPYDAKSLPTLLPDGLIEGPYGSKQRLFLSPQQIGR